MDLLLPCRNRAHKKAWTQSAITPKITAQRIRLMARLPQNWATVKVYTLRRLYRPPWLAQPSSQYPSAVHQTPLPLDETQSCIAVTVIPTHPWAAFTAIECWMLDPTAKSSVALGTMLATVAKAVGKVIVVQAPVLSPATWPHWCR